MADSGNLEAALLDQRMRADRHRANFESLKAQHLNLQESHQNLRVEYETLSENYDKLHHKSQEIIRTLQTERDGKIMECEELKAQAMTSQKLEHLQMQLTEEIEVPYRKRMDAVESDLEALRSEYNKLRYNYTFLKSEYEAATASHHSVLEELKAKHEAEVSSYIHERKELLARHERDIPQEVQRIRHLQRENHELQQKVKALLAEIEELQAQKEHTNTQNEKSYQLQSRQLAELEALTKTLEIERSSLAGQVHTLQEELGKVRNEHQTLSGQINHAHRETVHMKRKADEMEHKYKMEISELKMQHLHRCRELEQLKDECVAENVATQGQVEALQQALHDQETRLASKEREVEQRVQVMREREWEKHSSLQREKIELEERLSEIERVQPSVTKESQQQLEISEDNIRDLQSQKSNVESELSLVRSQLQERSERCQTLEAELRQLSAVNKKYQTLFAEHRSLQQSEQELQGSHEKLEGTLHLLEDHLTRAQDDLQRLKETHRTTLDRERQSWCGEKEVLVSRIEECQSQQQALSEQLNEARRNNKKLQKHYKKQVQELKLSVDVLTAKEEQLTLEKEALRKSLSSENQKVKRRFTNLQKRQKEFLFLLHNDPFSARGQGEHASLHAFAQEETHHQQQLQGISDRLDQLAANAQHHDSALVSNGNHPISPSEHEDSEHSASDTDI